MTAIALTFAAWFALGLVVGPPIGRHLARRSAALDEAVARHPAGSRRGGAE